MLALLRLLPIARLMLRPRGTQRRPPSAAAMIGLVLALAAVNRLRRRGRA